MTGYPVINPAPEKALCQVPLATDADIDRALENASRSYRADQLISQQGEMIVETNRLPYGLSANVWARDLARTNATARRLQFASVMIDRSGMDFAWPSAAIVNPIRDATTDAKMSKPLPKPRGTAPLERIKII